MTPDQFCYWLQGYAEITRDAPNETQWQIITDHLDLVFTKVTPQRAPRPVPVPHGLDLDDIVHATRAAKDAFKAPSQSDSVRCCVSSELPKPAAQARYCVRTKEPGVYTLEDTKGPDTVGEVIGGPIEAGRQIWASMSSDGLQRINLVVDGPIGSAPVEPLLTSGDLRVGGNIRTVYDVSHLSAVNPAFTQMRTC